MTDASSRRPRPSDDAVYGAVAARRLQFDNLVWQVPVLSLTAQAFLFTVALSPGTARLPRTVACTLSIVASFLSVQIMTRHRQAEITDAAWLAMVEVGAELLPVHGDEWRQRRNKQSGDGWIFTPLVKLPGYRTWAVGLSLFGLAAVLILILTWTDPRSLVS